MGVVEWFRWRKSVPLQCAKTKTPKQRPPPFDPSCGQNSTLKNAPPCLGLIGVVLRGPFRGTVPERGRPEAGEGEGVGRGKNLFFFAVTIFSQCQILSWEVLGDRKNDSSPATGDFSVVLCHSECGKVL